MTPFYRFAYLLVTALLKTFFRFTITGRENLPEKGAYVLAANHVSYLDPPVVGVSCGRQVLFMAKKELFDVPILAPVIRALGAFPVVRESADLKSLRHAVTLLREGNIVGIFTEGARSESGELNEGEPGTAFLVKQAKVPLVPCAIRGTFKPVKKNGILPSFSTITVTIGKPLLFDEMPGDLPNRDRLNLFTAKVMESLRNLLEA